VLSKSQKFHNTSFRAGLKFSSMKDVMMIPNQAVFKTSVG
jgi:hypothetical protein